MTSKPTFRLNVCTCLTLSLLFYLSACGPNAGPVHADANDSPEYRNEYVLKQFAVEERNGIHRSVPELQGIPSEYRLFLETNTRVLESLVWVDHEHPTGHVFIEDEDKVEDLAAYLEGEAVIEVPPLPVEYENDRQACYSEEDAWNMYLAHVAHSLKVEVQGLVPWSLSEYTDEEISLLFDSRYLLQFAPSNGLYKFSSRLPGGRQGVTDWSSSVGYEFLELHDMIGTQEETVFNFTNWIRENIVHSNTSTPDNWDGYPGFPPVDKILYPPEGHRHWTTGCAGTTSLYIAVLRSVNVPVYRGISHLATQGGPEHPHHRAEFPTLGIGLAHSDDAHNELYRRGVNEIPVDELFYSKMQLRELIDEPALDDGAPSKGEQAFYNLYSRAVGNAFKHLADSILKRRARDLLGSGDNTLEDLLTARVCSPSDCLWKPPFDYGERMSMTEEIDSALSDIGSGDILEGSRIVLRR